MIEARGIELQFDDQRALAAVDVALGDTGLIALTGHSGSGKSSLLHVLSGLRPPTGGTVLLDGRPLRERPSAQLRGEVFAFIFQDHFLVPYLSAYENTLAGVARPGEADRERAIGLLADLGLGGISHRRASKLSGGERQRVAVARGLVRGARYLFADEPTAALDRSSAERVFALLRRSSRDRAVLLVTHDAQGLAMADRFIELRDGRIAADRGAHPAID
ncbi:MAG: ATP-binding cassette domain-containing protein [Chloroflexota bacterium]|nr:ATP-binding cassette domain-containing protein [Chloroflexota bacterium]